MTAPQTNQFLPLLAAPPSGNRPDFQVTVIPQREQAQSFQALEKKPTALHKNGCEPKLSVQRDGGRITNIHIQCNCGQTIDLACVYEDPPKA